jgi:uncharacterized protein YndB with AHSA1/START domain
MNKQSHHSNIQVKVVKAFSVPAEKVFAAWTDPSIIGRWMFGPNVREEEILKLATDPRKNGGFSFVVKRDGETINHLGTYLEFDPPHRLVFTWGIESESEGESVVRIDIVPTGDGCRLTLVHEMQPQWEEYADRTRDAWSYMLDKLDEIFN